MAKLVVAGGTEPITFVECDRDTDWEEATDLFCDFLYRHMPGGILDRYGSRVADEMLNSYGHDVGAAMDRVNVRVAEKLETSPCPACGEPRNKVDWPAMCEQCTDITDRLTEMIRIANPTIRTNVYNRTSHLFRKGAKQ